jgi:hypothetical protein
MRVKPSWRVKSGLVKLRVLCLCSLQNGDVRIGVFPEDKKLLVLFLCVFHVSRQHIGASELKSRQGR